MSHRRGVMYLVLASCGSGSSIRPVDAAADAPLVDAMTDAAIDAAPDAAPTDEVTVITKGFLPGQPPALPVAGVQVVSNRADGSFLAMATSDPVGVAHVEVAPGGSVTAIYVQLAQGFGAQLATIMGVKPGDHLVFQQLDVAGDGSSLGGQTYTWPAQPNAGEYIVATSCISGGAPPTLTSIELFEGTSCHAEPMDVLFTVWSNSIDPVLTQCGWRENVTFSTTTPVSLASWQDAVTATVEIDGVSPTVSDVSLVFNTIIDDRTPALRNSKSGPPIDGQLAGTFNWCTFGDRVMAYAMLARADLQGHIQISESIPASQTTWSVSNPQLPPWVDPASFAASSVTGTASWTLVPDIMNVSDGVFVSLFFTQLIDGSTPGGTWQLVLPPNTTTVTLPTLPDALAKFAPSASYGMYFQEVGTYDFPTVTGYDAVRALGTGIALCPMCAQRMGLVPRSTVSWATPQ